MHAPLGFRSRDISRSPRACSESPHFAPAGCVTARDPGTTMASSGITSGSLSARRVNRIAHQIVHRDRTIQNRSSPQHRAPLHDRSLIHAGIPADQHFVFNNHRQRATGSSTPPICAAAEIWQCFPTCAQLPTSACESIMVPSPTYAPTFTNIGGMQITPRPI